MEAWRTSCPRLPVWEDAMDRGLIFFEVVPEFLSSAPHARASLYSNSIAPQKSNSPTETPYSAAGCAVVLPFMNWVRER